MSTQKQILTVGITFLVVFTILFFNIKKEYETQKDITIAEIEGLKQISEISKLDIVLKNIRGLEQLNKKENTTFIAEQARRNIEKLQIEHTGNSDDNTSVEDIYKNTDEALYEAKQSGRNKVSLVNNNISSLS